MFEDQRRDCMADFHAKTPRVAVWRFALKAPRLSWDDLRLFVAVARRGTISAAAAELGISQPTAGRRLAALQRDVGAPLVQRSGRGLVLTDEGREVLLHAERMEDHALALDRSRASTGSGIAGNITISTSEWFATHVLAAPLAQLAATHSSLTVELLTDSGLADLDRRDAEIAFRFQPFTSPQIVQRRFTMVRYGLFAAPHHVAREGWPMPGAAGVRLIGLNADFQSSTDIRWMRGLWPDAAFAVQSNSRDVQARACAEGAGLAVLPRTLGAAFELVSAPDLEPPGKAVHLGYHQDLRRLTRLRLVLDLLNGEVAKEI